MSTKNITSEKSDEPNVDQIQSEYNTLESVEAVYTADEIDIIDCVNAKDICLPSPTRLPLMAAANDDSAYADAEIYSLDSARLAKHERSTERRASKSQLTDRRCVTRIDANGEPELDRREANRIANIEAIRSVRAIESNTD